MDAALTDAFEANRPRLKRLAYRMLGSVAEAEDAVQDAWLRWTRAGRRASPTRPPGWCGPRRGSASTACARPRPSARPTAAPGCPSR